MPWNEEEQYLKTVLKQVHFLPDRESIEEELRNHFDDFVSDALKQGMEESDARQNALQSMGDPIVIGKQLNKIHNPLIGWIDIVIEMATVLAVIFTLYYWGAIGVMTISNALDSNQGIPKDVIAATLDLDEKVTLDDTIYHFYRLIYGTDGDLYLLWTTRFRNLFGNGWTNSNIGTITDESGTEYYGGGGSSGGLISYGYVQLRDFNPSSRTIYIDYDYYNRSFHIQIDLPEDFMKAGESHES